MVRFFIILGIMLAIGYFGWRVMFSQVQTIRPHPAPASVNRR